MIAAPTWLSVAREYFPDADDAMLDYIIWNRTGFPSFWDTDGGRLTVEQVYRSQLARYQDFHQRGVAMCDCCGGEAKGSKRFKGQLCGRCERQSFPSRRIEKKRAPQGRAAR